MNVKFQSIKKKQLFCGNFVVQNILYCYNFLISELIQIKQILNVKGSLPNYRSVVLSSSWDQRTQTHRQTDKRINFLKIIVLGPILLYVWCTYVDKVDTEKTNITSIQILPLSVPHSGFR